MCTIWFSWTLPVVDRRNVQWCQQTLILSSTPSKYPWTFPEIFSQLVTPKFPKVYSPLQWFRWKSVRLNVDVMTLNSLYMACQFASVGMLPRLRLETGWDLCSIIVHTEALRFSSQQRWLEKYLDDATNVGFIYDLTTFLGSWVVFEDCVRRETGRFTICTLHTNVR